MAAVSSACVDAIKARESEGQLVPGCPICLNDAADLAPTATQGICMPGMKRRLRSGSRSPTQNVPMSCRPDNGIDA